MTAESSPPSMAPCCPWDGLSPSVGHSRFFAVSGILFLLGLPSPLGSSLQELCFSPPSLCTSYSFCLKHPFSFSQFFPVPFFQPGCLLLNIWGSGQVSFIWEASFDSQTGFGSFLCYGVMSVCAWHPPSRLCSRITVGVRRNLGSSSHSLGPLWDRMGRSHIHSLYDGELGLQAKGGPGEMSYLE